MALKVLDGPFIEAGESLSSAIDCSGAQMVRITMPLGWTEAPLTFEFSTDGTVVQRYVRSEGICRHDRCRRAG